MSLQAYTAATARAESPSDLEYRLFGQVTRALVHASTLDPSDIAGQGRPQPPIPIQGVDSAGDCSDSGNALANPVRAQIISLSLFVNRHSSAVMRGEETFQELIDINRMIMQGLAGAAQAA